MGRPNLAVVNEEDPTFEVETLTCACGHMWQRPPAGGVPPRTCPEHRRFMEEPLSQRCSPPARVLKEWRTAAALLEDDEYVKRWTRTWEQTVRLLAARAKTFRGLEIEPIEIYVRHSRLAELHRLYAEETPYVTSEQTGMVRQHPGWEAARIEERLAKESARELGLVSAKQSSQGGNDDGRHGSEPDDGGDAGDRVIDDQLGPDGKPL